MNNNILGVDIGYGYTKSYFLKNGLDSQDFFSFDMFPTAISKFIPRTTFTAHKTVITINDEDFIVGDTALREGVGLINTRRTDFVGSNAYCAVLAYALTKTLKDPDILILGLPPGQYSKEYCTSLTSHIHSIKVKTSDDGDIHFPKLIKFIPQGAGIFFSHVRSGNADNLNKKVAVIDVGYYTLDTLFFVKGKYVENSARSHQLGVSKIYEQVKKEFCSTYRTFIKNDETVERLLLDDKVNVAGKEYTLDTSSILDSYNSEALSLIGNYIEELPDEADLIIAGGGGVRFLKNGISGKIKINLVGHPQYANAKGYFEFGRHVMNARGEG
jgi:hypothetical protein